MKIHQLVSQRSGTEIANVAKVLTLLEEGATIPFIARYRKEQTGSLNEVELLEIRDLYKSFLDLEKRKEAILKAINDQGLLSSELNSKITACWDEKQLEDLYLPFKRKVKTKATTARENGLEGLAKIIMSQRSSNLEQQASRFVRGKVSSVEEAFLGAQHIIAEWINENARVRDIIRDNFAKYASITSKVVKGKKEEGAKFRDYFDYSGPLRKIPSHRLLAILRGEKEGFLKAKVDIDFDRIESRICNYFIKQNTASTPFIEVAVQDALKRLILPSLRNEALKEAKEKADQEAISIFARNAQSLLLSSPLGAKRILGIDPGFRSGCKVVVIDEFSNLKANTNIYPHPPQKKIQDSESTISNLLSKYDIEAIAIGNGTAGKETYQWLRKILSHKNIEIFLVNEDGASIYSASEIGRAEFPDHDITVRGAVSIARRLMDPLAELVKIDPKSIGVGQYQHDVNQKKLKDSLTETVISCVNKVGINVNTASQHLLSYVSGLGPTIASNIVNYRKENGKISDLVQLKRVPRLGSKAFEQSAGFLRIKEGNNPLDNTGVHPESYTVVKKMAKDIGSSIKELIGNEDLIKQIKLNDYVSEKIGFPSLNDIIQELLKPGLDPRSKAQAISFDDSISSITDLKVGQVVTGVVTNLTKFGAFLDIGIKESALLHISQIVDRFISDPSEELTLNQEIKVKVLEVDLTRKRISVTAKNIT